jgi:outer membrane autotransporter protein
LQYTYLDEDGFQETGADSLNLQVGDRQTDDLVSELGMRIARVFEMNGANLIPEVGVAWSHNFNIDDRDITASFAGAPGTSFTVDSQDIDDGAVVDAGLTFVHKSGWSTAIRYIGEFREDFESNGIIGEIQYAF